MIQTGFDTKVKTYQLIENQLPSFILSESPKAVDFFKQYYISQEYQGGPVDIAENLDQYLDLDNLTPNVIVGFTTLSSSISSTDTVVNVSSTKGFPNSYGLLKIDDEIITYTGITTNSFTGCIRGFSGITSYRDTLNPNELVFSSTVASSHSSGSSVQNLSVLFLKEFYKKLKYSLTPGLEESDFVPNLNVGNFIKEARTFYESKGTEESFRILFNVLYGETPKVFDLERLVLKASGPEFIRRRVVIAEKISGNPLKLVGQTVKNSSDSSSQASVSEVEIFTRDNITYYKLGLFVGFNDDELIDGTFSITPKTKVLEQVSIGSSTILVDSTIGFPQSGTLICNSNTITYTDKTINQFLGCNISSTISASSTIRSNEVLYGYEDGDSTKKVEMRITGVLSEFKELSNIKNISEGEKIYVQNVGEKILNPKNKTYKEVFANSWIYNTRVRYQVKINNGTTLTLYAVPDKSSLRVGDSVEIFKRDSTEVISSAIVQSIQNATVTLSNASPAIPSGIECDIQRKIKIGSTSSPGLSIQYGKIVANVQNVYNENDEYMYVASNSIPENTITKEIISEQISSFDTTSSNPSISGKNSETEKYSIIAFQNEVKFETGDEVIYSSQNGDISGLVSGNKYYVEVLSNKKNIRLYSSRSFITIKDYELSNPPFVEFLSPTNTTGYHKFTLSSQYTSVIGPQKLLRKFPLDKNIQNGTNQETELGTIGLTVDGVEIFNYKSENKIYYGPIEKIDILNSGKNYDVINPPQIEISSPSVGTTALAQAVVSGSIVDVLVDPQDFDIDNIVSITVVGGNGKNAVLSPVVTQRYREVEFDGRLSTDNGGVNITNETLTFSFNHNFTNGEKIVYNKNGNLPIGIGTFGGSNANMVGILNTSTLVDGEVYYAQKVNANTIKLYSSFNDFNSGINTIGFTTTNTQGIHKFRVASPKNTLSEIKVINPGSGYKNQKLRVKPSGISTNYNWIEYSNHNFNDGELVTYNTTGSAISGLSTDNQYYILKVDEDRFRLANAGIGGTIKSNLESKNYSKFNSTGSGYHIFNYPEISVVIDYTSVGAAGTIVTTPIVRGEIVDSYLYESGTGYGTTILNYHKKPLITLKSGKNCILKPIISNGQIIDVNIQSSGSEYYSTPELVVTGIGSGAILRPVISNGSVSNVIIINSGIGYSEDNTTISVENTGKNAVVDVSIRALTVNNYEKFGQEILVKTQENLQYGLVGYSTNVPYNNNLESVDNHSPIIGWAYDGNPIYGPYGYSDPTDSNSETKLLKSGYILSPSSVINRPQSVSSGYFVEDYIFNNSGDLDEHNGRYCVTPEFPYGTYAYFATIKPDITVTNKYVPEFPYFIGNTYHSKFIADNKILNQEFNFNTSSLIRNTFPYRVNEDYIDNDFLVESNEIINQFAIVESTNKGVINDIEIISGGINYSVGDKVLFDESNTSGSGFGAEVGSVDGKEIIDIVTTANSYSNVVFIKESQNSILGIITASHQILDKDTVTISGLSTFVDKLFGQQLVSVTSNTASVFKEIPSNGSIGIVTDIYISNIPNYILSDSSLTIGGETLTILNVFASDNILRVKRGISGIAHTVGTAVTFVSDKLSIPVRVDNLNSKLNSKIYFNPSESVGIGTTPGLENSKEYYIGSTQKTVSIPNQLIYLPNHGLVTNQEVNFNIPSGASQFTVRNSPSSSDFTFSGGTVYVVNKSKDYIGIVTQVGLTTSTKGLYFSSYTKNNNNLDYEYNIQTKYPQVTGKIEKIKSIVSVSTSHELTTGDKVILSLIPNLSVGIGTSTAVSIKIDPTFNILTVNQKSFTSSSVNSSTDTITINSHGFKTGDKVLYTSGDTLIGGLDAGSYYVYKLDNNSFKLCYTYFDSISSPPTNINFTSSGGSLQKISLINPQIEAIRGNDLVFDLSDSSLSGYNLRIYEDESFNNEFTSSGNQSFFNVERNGIVGSTSANLTLRYSDDIPSVLHYALEKSGFISTSDTDVINSSQINYVNSTYNGEYTISGIGATSFSITLNREPERLIYTQNNCTELKYRTTSKTAKGSVSSVKIISNGVGYKSLPKFVSIESKTGSDGFLKAKSKNIGSINKVRIVDIGFEYASDKTLRPQAFVSPYVGITSSNTISDEINVVYGGRNYVTAPDFDLVNTKTGTKINSGGFSAVLSGNAIQKINIESKPIGLNYDNHTLFSKNNTNGVGIVSMISTSSGIVTCYVNTPALGYTQSTAPFSAGDKVFVENISRINDSGDGFNSSENGYNFFTVKSFTYNAQIPAILEIDISKYTTNPGIAKTYQNSVASVINYNNYPQFELTIVNKPFILNESLLIYDGTKFIEEDIKITEYSEDYIKVYGRYTLNKNTSIKGKYSGTEAFIISVDNNYARFDTDYSSKKDYGWVDDTGKLNNDYQSLPDNDYYQNLSYTVKSSITFDELSDPVNRLLHTTGLKNFSDTEIKRSVSVGFGSTINATNIIVDIIGENRVDTIYNFDFARDSDVADTSSKSIEFENTKLSDYFKSKTNRVLSIDDITESFSGSDTSFELNHASKPIFVKTFNPSEPGLIEQTTGKFTIKDHFFSNGEQLIYSSNVLGGELGIGATLNSSGIVTTILPSDVYVIKDTNDTFKLSTRSDYAALGIAVTFTSLGSGSTHQLEMTKKMEKTIISIDNIVQTPIQYTPISYTLTDAVGTSSTIFSLSGITSIRLKDLLKIDDEYVNVISVGIGTTAVGPITGNGNYKLVQVERGFVGTSASNHTSSTSCRVYRGSYNIVKNQVHFTEAPKGSYGEMSLYDNSNLKKPFSKFSGRVFLRKNYSGNKVYDDISGQFSGIGKTFTLKSAGSNTVGIETGSGIVFINGVFQAPTTINNLNNNYSLIQNSGITSVVFSGVNINNSEYISVYDVNQNKLPRGGVIVSLGSSGGLGIAPLVGASVTAGINGGGSIISIGIGTTGSFGSGYHGNVSIGVTDSTGNGSGAVITATVGAGGSLAFNISNGGSGYQNPIIQIPSPSYENLPLKGVSRLGIGLTTETGTGLLVTLDVGSSSTTGIGSTLFEVKTFNIVRGGYNYRVGDVLTPVGLVTAKGLSSPITDFYLTVTDVYYDSSSIVQFGQLDYIDSIKYLQDGERRIFPLRYNNSLAVFEKDNNDPESQVIDLAYVLVIFINGVLQDPYTAYTFNGGSAVVFNEAPKPEDTVDILFYNGTRGEDIEFEDVNEIIKSGDELKLFKYPPTNLLTENTRIGIGITGVRTIQTNLYSGIGIDNINYRPISWTKQKNDLFVEGQNIYKSRESLESLVFPTAKIIKTISSNTTKIYVDTIKLFKYENPLSFDGLIVDSKEPIAANITAVVSSSGTVQSLNILNGGFGYSGATVNLNIATGVGTTSRATATATVSLAGTITTPITIIDAGIGYSQTNPPQVLVPEPSFKTDIVNIKNSTTIQGFSGIITGITTSTGTSGNPLALKFYIHKSDDSLNNLTSLSVGDPIYIFDTQVGTGLTSIDQNDGDVVGVGTEFLDNIYYIHQISTNSTNGIITCNVKSNSQIVGIATTGNVGKFSLGIISDNNGLGNSMVFNASGFNVSAGLSSYPSIQRKNIGLRKTGALTSRLT